MQAFSTNDKAAMSGKLNKTTLLDQNKIYTEFVNSYTYIILERWKVTKKRPFLKQQNYKKSITYGLVMRKIIPGTVFMYHNYHLTCHVIKGGVSRITTQSQPIICNSSSNLLNGKSSTPNGLLL